MFRVNTVFSINKIAIEVNLPMKAYNQTLQHSQDINFMYHISIHYSKCPKISYTDISEQMVYANNADPDQTAPDGAF